MSAAAQPPRIKDRAQQILQSHANNLVGLSHQIYENPELSMQEHQAATWCADMLSNNGFSIDFGVCGLDTAFVASIGSGPLVVAICSEYDALPEIGHACGHNVIAAAGVGAGLALAPLADELGITIRVLGTPGEEGDGGKIVMLERGSFDGVNASLMVHPWPIELIHMPCLAVARFAITYEGKESHASAFPDRGINAADALTVAQVGVGLLRQHARDGDQVHGITTHGGAAPNIVPGHTEATYYVRSRSLGGLDEWVERVEACFKAGAMASGATLEFVELGRRYSEFRVDESMARLYQTNAENLGRRFAVPAEQQMTASTDMANVSLALPAIHPTLGVGSLPAVNHQAEFARHCATPEADQSMLDGAVAMAWTAIDLATDAVERKRLTAYSFQHAE